MVLGPLGHRLARMPVSRTSPCLNPLEVRIGTDDWGTGPSAVIADRIGNTHRFTSLESIRAYSWLVPKTSQSGPPSARLPYRRLW